MAEADPRAESARNLATLPDLPPNLPAVGRILANFDRDQVEGFIEVAIWLLDTIDGDPEDQQANGDELDANGSEEDFMDHPPDFRGGAGCPLSDPGGCEHDGREPDHDAE